MKLHSILCPFMSLMMVLALFWGNSKEAEAGSFVISASANFLTHYNIAMTHEYVADNDIYYGGVVSIQPEIRFADWFGVGLDVGIGGTAAVSHWANKNVKAVALEVLLTAKFIGSIGSLDLWGELGTGYEGMHGRLKLYDDEWHNGTYQWATRARVGATYNFADNMGLGLHFAYIYRFIIDSSFEAGLHFTYHFGNFN